MQRRAAERGAILPIILGAILLLVSLAYGGFTLMRVILARQEAQRAADAAVLVATTIIKHDGLPFDGVKQGQAEQIARQNSTLPLEFHWEPPVETDTRVDITCRVTAKVEAPAFIFSSGNIEAGGTARGTAAQTTITEVTKKYPKLVLVLDFSGSMLRAPGDNGQHFLDKDDQSNSYHVLLRAVNMLLELNYDIKYGLTIFAGAVLENATVAIALGNIDTIKTNVNGDLPCPTADGSADCGTATWDALKRAGQLFEAADHPEEGRFVIFVSDGQPTTSSVTVSQGISKSRAEVEKLWNMGVTMFTIHMVNTKSQEDEIRAFMKGISGPPDDRGNEAWYADANNEADLRKRFKRFGGAIACQVGPISPLPPDPKKMHVFIKAAGGDESPLLDSTEIDGGNGNGPADEPGDLWDEDQIYQSGNYFLLRAGEDVLYVSPPACERIMTNHEKVVMRYASPQLTQ